MQNARITTEHHPEQYVQITLYRSVGESVLLKFMNAGRACDLAYVILQKLMNQALHDKPVSLTVKTWSDNWLPALLRGGWRPPIVLVNGRVFSQGTVPDADKLLQLTGRLLNDSVVQQAGAKFKVHEVTHAGDGKKLQLFYSPACAQSRRLREYLDAHHVDCIVRDVSESPSARERVQELTGRLALPVLEKGGETIVGFDPASISRFLHICGEPDESAATGQERRMTVSTDQRHDLVNRAKRALQRNRVGKWTRPSAKLYPHQWNWDSGFCSRAYLHFQPEQAYAEIESLFAGQWRDGFLPHIKFNPAYLDHFPGPVFWQAETSGKVPAGVYTSGTGQPPVLASMLAPAMQLDPQPDRARAFFKRIYPRLKASHDWFFQHRDPAGEGLITLVHPWEAGLDNPPLWDEPLRAIRQTSDWAVRMRAQYDQLAEMGGRPKRAYIEQYSYLVERLFRIRYDSRRIMAEHPFRVQDVLFNSLLCRSEKDLALIAEEIGEDGHPCAERAERLAAAINQKLWHEPDGIYYSYDVVANRPIERTTAFSYMPLYAGVCSVAQSTRLIESLTARCFCAGEPLCMAVPSYDVSQTDDKGEFYWRGPVWANICWFLTQGMRWAGEPELAEAVEDSFLHLAAVHGIHEFYEPETGRGLGEKDYSCTAAVILDLIKVRD